VSEQTKQLERLIEVIVRMIPKERQARDVYRDTAAWAPTEMTRILFEHLSLEEEKHESKLQAVLKILQKELAEAKKKSKS